MPDSARKFDLVIFDCDGVLVDSENLAIEALLEIISEAGLTLGPAEAHAMFLGRSLASISEILVSDYRLTLTPDSLERMRDRLYAAFKRELAPIEGIAKTLQALGIPFCVASSSQLERVRLSLEVTGLLEMFDGRMFSASMAAQGKPAPDLFLMAAKALGATALQMPCHRRQSGGRRRGAARGHDRVRISRRQPCAACAAPRGFGAACSGTDILRHEPFACPH